jgi:GH43 family beta-xylosidase
VSTSARGVGRALLVVVAVANSFTVDASGTEVIVYHARSYRDITGDPLHDPNRHTRAQYVRWRADGTPEFGEPVPDGVPAPVPATAAR